MTSLIDISNIIIEFGELMSNYICITGWDVIIHPCHNFNDGELKHRWSRGMDE